MRIVEEQSSGYCVCCDCGHEFFITSHAGVVGCLECGRDEDPRHLRYKWARGNDPLAPNGCQAL